mgnify:FL=1
MLYAFFIAALIFIDQAVKYLVRTKMPLYSSLPLIPHVVELTHVRNTGAAFSIFSEHTWILAAVSAVVAVLIAAALLKKTVSHRFGVASLSLVLAGALGNLIDRVCLGYVTDMFNLLFMRFAVFNVADICVVAGGISTCVYLLFFYEKWEKKPMTEQSDDQQSDADG